MDGMSWLSPNGAGQSRLQVSELSLAFILSAVVGIEREIRQKSAGLRTHTLVGVSAALFMLISKYGFSDVLVRQLNVVDPSRVAAQVVSGIGFIGGGVIFMRRDVVRGLTTAASIWYTAALGMACGAGLPILALTMTALHSVIMFVFPAIERRLPKPRKLASDIFVSYENGKGLLRSILVRCTKLRFTIDNVRLDGPESPFMADRAEITGNGDQQYLMPHRNAVTVFMRVKGKKPISHLVTALSDIEGVYEVGVLDIETSDTGGAFE